MILPETVKVGLYIYRVVQHEQLRDDDGTKCWGTIKYADGIINIETGHTPERTLVTLLHEVLHGLDDVAGLNLKEKQITRLAPVLASFLKDNGWLRE